MPEERQLGRPGCAGRADRPRCGRLGGRGARLVARTGRGVRAPARHRGVAGQPVVPVRPLRRGEPRRLLVVARQGHAAPSPGPGRGDPCPPAPLRGELRRVRPVAVPGRSGRPGVPPRHRHALPRGHDHRGAEPRRHPPVAAAPALGAPHGCAGQGRHPRPRAGLRRPPRDGGSLPGRLGALRAVPRTAVHRRSARLDPMALRAPDGSTVPRRVVPRCPQHYGRAGRRPADRGDAVPTRRARPSRPARSRRGCTRPPPIRTGHHRRRRGGSSWRPRTPSRRPDRRSGSPPVRRPTPARRRWCTSPTGRSACA